MKRLLKQYSLLLLMLVACDKQTTQLPVPTLTYTIVDTGVSQSYDNNTTMATPSVGEPFYGQDSNYSGNQPSYTDNGDGTITDNVTGLMWAQDMGEAMAWADAAAFASASRLGGYSDWRVPTIKELYSLALYTGECSSGAIGNEHIKFFIDDNYFDHPLGDISINSGREIDAQCFSATEYVGKTMNGDETIFGVNFVDGRIKGYPKVKAGEINKRFIRLVRGNSAYGKNSFMDNGDGTISDLATGLMWQKCDSGVGMDWEDALSYAESAEYAGYSDWRLPNIKELQSIVDYSRSPQTTLSAAIDPVFEITNLSFSDIEDVVEANNQSFTSSSIVQNCIYPYFWSSTVLLDGPTPRGASACYVAFGEGFGIMNGKLMDVHGAGCLRSDNKEFSVSGVSAPQGDLRISNNFVRLVRNL